MASHLQNKMAILRPRITEKASLVTAGNVYAFEILASATKKDVARNIIELYKVTPIKVNITRNPAKNVMYKGKVGRTSAIKKAYVYLKKGDKLEI